MSKFSVQQLLTMKNIVVMQCIKKRNVTPKCTLFNKPKNAKINFVHLYHYTETWLQYTCCGQGN